VSQKNVPALKHVIFGVRFESRKDDKKQTYMRTEAHKLYSRPLNISAKCLQNWSL